MSCRVCGFARTAPVLSVPDHPVCTRFLPERDAEQPLFPLSLVSCEGCATVQLDAPVPVEQLVAPYDWIRYNEPEGHLDALAEAIRSRYAVGADTVVCGVSSKDDTLLQRLEKLGAGRTWRVDLAADLDVAAPGAGLETIQDRLSPERAAALATRHGAADVVIARHIFEHAYDLRRFATAVVALAKPGGLVVFETPDCSASFAAGDCTVVWEEHLVYLTPGSYRGLVTASGLGVVDEFVYPYPYENSLVIVASASQGARTPVVDLAAERQLTADFARKVDARRTRVRRWLRDIREAGAVVAMFGAGHLACTFLRMMDVADEIDCVIDDHPRKQGLFMPGSRLPIVPSSAMADRGVSVALMTLSPESEAAVARKQQPFVDGGGRLLSIFPNSPRALDAAWREDGR